MGSSLDQNARPGIPVRAWVARVLSYQGRNETFGSLSALFQAICERLRASGALPGVYPVLAQVKQRILNQGQPLSVDDVVALVWAHQEVSAGRDPLVLGAPRFVLSIQGIGERMTYHREFVHHLKIPQKPLLTLSSEALIEVLANLLHPRHFSLSDKQELLDLSFPQQDGLGVLRILDTIYKATFSRTIRKELCDPKVQVPLPEGAFLLAVDAQRVAHFSASCVELVRNLLFRLYRTPDLATVLDSDDRSRTRVQDALRLLSGALHDVAVLPQKREEVAAILRDRRAGTGPDDGEELEEI